MNACLRLLLCALMLAALAGTAHAASGDEIVARAPDAFYDPPARLPARPGTLLRSEPLRDVILPAGMRGWRILYTTTVDDRRPATAAATVFAPLQPAGLRPVILFAHGTTGLLQRCMPSLVSAPALGIPAQEEIVRAGWVVVATDYSFTEKGGPHPYLIGEGEARAGLDSVRAARQMRELTLSPKAVVWGHSQGAHAALWTGIVGPRYAPDVKIVGIAAVAPPGDIAKLLALNVPLDKRLGPYIAVAYSRFYPNIKFEQAIRPGVFSAAREIAGLCGFIPPEDPERIGALMTTFDGRALVGTNAALAGRLAQNAADRPIAAPLLLVQGLDDPVVLPPITDAYVDKRCAAGQRLEYWKFAAQDHSSIMQPGSPLAAPLAAWTAARFAGERQAYGCKGRSF